MARKKFVITARIERDINELIGLGFTGQDIAAKYGINRTTLLSATKAKHGMTWDEYQRLHNGKCRVSVRQALYQKGVMEGDTTALIYLNKTMGYLEEKDRQMIELKKEQLKQDAKIVDAHVNINDYINSMSAAVESLNDDNEEDDIDYNEDEEDDDDLEVK